MADIMPDLPPPSAPCDLKILLDALQVDHQHDSGKRLQVQELGKDIDPSFERRYTRPSSMATLSSIASWRSTSVTSKASTSTELTSNYSTYSSDNFHFSIRRPGSLPSYHTCDTASNSTTSYDGLPTLPESIPKCAPYESSSTLSEAVTPPRKHFRRLRNLGFRSLYRQTSKTSLAESSYEYKSDVPVHIIASRPQTSWTGPVANPHHASNPTSHHASNSFSHHAGNSISHHASNSTSRLVPEIDRQPRQRSALAKEEIPPWVDSLPAGVVNTGLSDMLFLERYGPPTPPSEIRTHSFAAESATDLAKTNDNERLQKITQRSDYQDLLTSQTADRDEFLITRTAQRTALDTAHDFLRTQSKAAQQAAMDELIEQHILSLHEAEDKQVAAEATLLETQAKEARDLAIATRHMEAYCAGHYTSTSDERHNREITPADRAELATALHLRDVLLPARHAAAINVLRAQQARRLRMRSARHDLQVRELLRHQRMSELEMERSCSAEIARWADEVQQTKVRLMCRWEVQMAGLEQRIADELGVVLDWRLPCVEIE